MRIIPLLAALLLPLSAAELPADAAALKARRDAKVAEINRVYANELEKLQKLALKNGNLAAANAIEAEIATAAPDPLKAISLDGKWDYRINGNLATKPRRFEGTNLIDDSGRSRPFKIEGNVLTIDWGKGMFEKITLDPTRPNLLSGVNQAGESFIYRREGSL